MSRIRAALADQPGGGSHRAALLQRKREPAGAASGPFVVPACEARVVRPLPQRFARSLPDEVGCRCEPFEVVGLERGITVGVVQQAMRVRPGLLLEQLPRVLPSLFTSGMRRTPFTSSAHRDCGGNAPPRQPRRSRHGPLADEFARPTGYARVRTTTSPNGYTASLTETTRDSTGPSPDR